MIEWKPVVTHNFPIMSHCYIKNNTMVFYAEVHSVCMKKGVLFNIINTKTGKITNKKVQAQYYCTIEELNSHKEELNKN